MGSQRPKLGEFILEVSDKQRDRVKKLLEYLAQAETVLINSISVQADEQGVLRGAELTELMENIDKLHKRSIELMEFVRKSAVQQEDNTGQFTPEVEEIAHFIAAMPPEDGKELIVFLRRKKIKEA